MSSYYDNFNRADSLTLGANWADATTLGYYNFNIASTKVRFVQGGVGPSVGIWTGAAIGDDQFSQTTLAGLGIDQFPIVRYSYVAGPYSESFYYGGDSYTLESGDVYVIGKFVDGTMTNLAVSGETPVNIGDIVRLEAIGTALTLYVNGVSVASTTDSLISSGDAGFYAYNDSNYDVFDNWSGGDLPVSPVVGPFVTSRQDQL